MTNKEILGKLLSYSEDLKKHYVLYQLLLFYFQNKDSENFFGIIEDNLEQVYPLFQTIFKTLLKNKDKIINALQLPYSNAKLEATNKLIKLIKQTNFHCSEYKNGEDSNRPPQVLADFNLLQLTKSLKREDQMVFSTGELEW